MIFGLGVTDNGEKEDLADLKKKPATLHAMLRKLLSFYQKNLSKLPITSGLYFFHMQRWVKFFN